MMITRFLTTCAAVAVCVAMTSFARAQNYPPPVYATPTAPYPQGSYPAPADYRRGPDAAPDFDSLDDDDDAPRGRGSDPGSMALPPPGPVMSPDDPRYGRPMGAPTYSDRGAPQGAVPQGPVMSPDDPRYGRPMAPPAVIYSNRPGEVQPAYSDRGYDQRPPGETQGVATGSVQQPGVDQDGRPTVMSALPADEQPETGPAQLAPNLRRQEVAFATKEPPGTLVVDTPNTYLYYVLGGGRAIRYGVRVGRDGFTWTGVQKIARKAEWPDWHPPPEMIDRQPYLPRFMAGGPGNPLGARAMYLGSTVYRIHGTNQPSTIGKFVSSGCIGMLNEDVSDLFDRVKVGTRVVVLPGGGPPTTTASAAPIPGPNAGGQPVYPSVPGAQPSAVQPLPPPVTIR
jgi:lipoprotein-anchoring transpeptidase ErfK/SrfK